MLVSICFNERGGSPLGAVADRANLCGTLDWRRFLSQGGKKLSEALFKAAPAATVVASARPVAAQAGKGPPADHNHTSPQRTSYDHGATVDKIATIVWVCAEVLP